MGAHTPGPWRHVLDARGRHLIVPATPGAMPLAQVFARIVDAHGYPARENADLFSAAPDLLAAAKRAERHLTRQIEYRNLEEDASSGARDALREAIAKAEGGRS